MAKIKALKSRKKSRKKKSDSSPGGPNPTQRRDAIAWATSVALANHEWCLIDTECTGLSRADQIIE